MRIILGLLLVLIVSCTPEHIGPQRVDGTDPAVLTGRKIYLINEGNFGRGTASLTAYLPAKKKAYEAVFNGANKGLKLGDVALDMKSYQSSFYLVVNYSAYIAQIDTSSLELKDSIQGMTSPRHIAIHGNRAFVSDLYARKIYVIDLHSGTIIKQINIDEAAEHLLVWSKWIVSNVSDQLILIDPVEMRIDTSLMFHTNIDRMRISSDSNLWVMTDGLSNSPAQLVRMESDSLKQKSFPISINDPRYFSINPTTDDMYYVEDQAIFRARYWKDSISISSIFPLNNQNVYAFDVDPKQGDLYLADALDFDQKSDIYRISPSGQLIDQFKAGIITSNFLFTP